MTPTIYIIIILLLGIGLVFAIKEERSRKAEADRQKEEATRLREKLGPLADAEKAVAAAKAEEQIARKGVEELKGHRAELEKEKDQLRIDLGMLTELKELDEQLLGDIQFNFEDSEQYKTAMTACREKQKAMAKEGKAISQEKEFAVGGNKTRGASLLKNAVKLVLRTFNSECEAAVANLTANNRTATEKKITRAADQIANIGKNLGLSISPPYLKLKGEEVALKAEMLEKLKEEKEARADELRQAREEDKIRREAEKAAADEAALEEKLEAARREAAIAAAQEGEEQRDAMSAQIAELEEKLAEAHKATERKKSMAEQTKAGFVYVISNLGCFGEDVVKIGMTRRANPQERVDELGDASVPFRFDVHAMIYSPEARTLEKKLHDRFEQRRVNRINRRKEFFHASLEEVKAAVREDAPNAMFLTEQEAREYRQSLAEREDAEFGGGGK